MRGAAAVAVAAGILVAGSEALQLVKRDASPAVIGLGIQRKSVASHTARDRLRRRQSKTVSETLDNEGSLYFANVSIGTPPQPLRLHIDTGSSDLWANSATSTLCSSNQATDEDGESCSVSGTYNANASSSYKYVDSDFDISYVDGSGASGDYVTDTLHIGGQDLDGLQMGIGYESTSPEGIIGIGYAVNEVANVRNGQGTYLNTPALMAKNGLIQSNAFSLWLDDLQANTGSILFGGIDTDKFEGELSTLPILKENNVFQEFLITLSGVSVSSNGKNQSLTSGLPTAVLLDSGSSLTYLPDDITQELFEIFQVQYDQESEAGIVDCSLANNKATVDFTFSSPTISVPMSELVIQDTTSSNDGVGESACIFGISYGGNQTSVLGDTFIRSAYLVYDLDNNEISLAQTDFSATSSNVMQIGTGDDAVPSASGVANPVSASVTAPAVGHNGVPTGSATGAFATTTVISAAGNLMPLPFGGFIGALLLALIGAL